MDIGAIVATVCAIYGWTPDYVLFRLSWPQVILYHDRGMEYDLARRGVILHRPEPRDESVMGGDGPDVAAIEAKYGDRIKRRG